MKLTIVIVSYNEKQYIEETINSCLEQNLPFDFEIIIGDDGSDDGSVDLVREYKERYPHIISYFVMNREKNEKIIPSIRVSNVLKKAFSISNGEFITVISGDDLLLNSDKLNKQIVFLENNSDYISCYTDYKKFGLKQADCICKMKCSLSEEVFWAKKYVHISCFVFRKSVLNNLLDRFCDDTGLIFSIIKTGKIKHLPGVDFGYRQRENSIMHKVDKLENYILEVMLYQDVLNFGENSMSSFCHFCCALIYVCVHRNKLVNKKYNKYLQNCNNYSNDILGNVQRINKVELFKFTVVIMMKAFLCDVYYNVKNWMETLSYFVIFGGFEEEK